MMRMPQPHEEGVFSMKLPSQKWLLNFCLLLSGFAIAVIIYLITQQMGRAGQTLRGIFTALQPIFVGIIMTYLFYPLANQCERLLTRHRCHKKVARIISVLVAAICMVFLFFLFGYLVLPQLISSITTLSGNLGNMLGEFNSRASEILENYGLPADTITAQWEAAATRFNAWLENDLVKTLMSITSGLFTVAKVAINLLIGVIVMVYLLYSRDHFVGQSKKILYAVCGNRRVCRVILECVRQINLIFGGFLTGKVIDSLIIGALCFISLTILQVPYVMLISVTVGVTNIIPVFGPFIGAIPCGFLLLLTDPPKCLVFVIFIIILQQIDGNLIGPMILGDSTGLPAFWVLFSLLLFQSLMGFWGMIIGVPLFASIYYLLKRLINHLLTKRNLPLATQDYVPMEGIDENGTPFFLQTSPRKSFFRRKKNQAEAKDSQETPSDIPPPPQD